MSNILVRYPDPFFKETKIMKRTKNIIVFCNLKNPTLHENKTKILLTINSNQQKFLFIFESSYYDSGHLLSFSFNFHPEM